MNNKFERLEREDVITIDSQRILVSNPTFRVSEFTLAVRETIFNALKGLTSSQEGWFAEGANCKVLKPGAKGWQKGKVRITLEFCPDEPEIKQAETDESSFNDICELINKIE